MNFNALTSLPSRLSLFPHRRISLSKSKKIKNKKKNNKRYCIPLYCRCVPPVLPPRDVAALHMVPASCASPFFTSQSPEKIHPGHRVPPPQDALRRSATGARRLREIRAGVRRHCALVRCSPKRRNAEVWDACESEDALLLLWCDSGRAALLWTVRVRSCSKDRRRGREERGELLHFTSLHFTVLHRLHMLQNYTQ